MKVAVYCHSIAPSIDGVCRRFTGLITELIRLGHEVILFTLEEHPLELPPMLLEVITLDHMCFPAYPGKKVARPNLSCFLTIMNGISKHKPDVIHVTCDGLTQMFVFAGMTLGVPVVGSFHTDIIDLITTHNAHIFQKCCVLTKECIDGIALDSSATTSVSFQEKLRSQGVHSEYILKTAVDTTMFNPSKRSEKLHQELTFNDPKGFLCVYVGRISKEKRIDTIFEAISALDNVYLALIGDGPTAQHWAGLHSKENKLYCKPKFLSHDELAEIYASSDLHVSASEFETLGNTVLEAQASNIAVVVPETQGFCNTVTTRDIEVQDEFSGYIGNEVNKASDIVMVQKKHDGYLFRPGDALDARRYIKQLKENADLRKRLGDNGRANVGRFTHSNIVKDMLNWYRRGIRNNQSRSYLKAMCIYFVLIGTIPFTIVALFCYDMVTLIMTQVLGMELDLEGNKNKKVSSKID